MPSCPTDDTFVDFIEGRLEGQRLSSFYDHASSCKACSATLAELSRSSAPDHSRVPHSVAVDGIERSVSGEGRESFPRPEAVGRYRPTEVLGVGGMGVVYLARDTQLNRNVALKVTRAGISAAGAQRMIREAQAMAKLSHRNVVTVHDVGLWENHVFVAMEHLEGGTLSRYLLEKPRSWREILEKFQQAGEGLVAAHRAHIVHRDFKPENVLLSAEGEVRVADFGLARLLNEAGFDTSSGTMNRHSKEERTSVPHTRMTRQGTVLGTPAYMAPEQIKGASVDHRADIWSFCASLYEALYCELPFPGRTPDEVLRHIELGSIRRVPVGSQVPRWLRGALLQGLMANPSARYGTMDELLAALTASPVARRAWKRPVALVGAFAGGLLALGILFAFITDAFRIHQRDGGVGKSNTLTENLQLAADSSPLIRQESFDVGVARAEANADRSNAKCMLVDTAGMPSASSTARASTIAATETARSAAVRVPRAAPVDRTRRVVTNPPAPATSIHPHPEANSVIQVDAHWAPEPSAPPSVVSRGGVPIIRD